MENNSSVTTNWVYVSYVGLPKIHNCKLEEVLLLHKLILVFLTFLSDSVYVGDYAGLEEQRHAEDSGL